MRLFSTVTTGFTLLAIVFTSTLSTYSLAGIPDLEANNDERSLSNPSYILGQYWFRKLNGSQALIDFPPAYDYLKNTLAKILPQTDLYNTTIEMTLLNSSKSNAFVMPGNHLYIYSDILEMITSEDMFYGLLAHEIAHLDLNHYERQSENSEKELQKMLVMLGAGVAAALAGADSDATSALWLGGIANQADNTLTYSRHQEQEADRRGREYLANAGLAPDGMTKLFQAFFKQALGRPKLEFLSTHPLPDSRLSDALNTSPKESILNITPITQFDFFRASLLAYRAGLENMPLNYLDNHIDNMDANLFAKALLFYLQQAPKKSIEYLNKVSSSNSFIDYLYVLSYASSNQNKKALNKIKRRLDIDPNNTLFSMLKSEINHTKPNKTYSDYLYENRLIWRTNLQYYQSKRNLPMVLNYKALLDFYQGQDKTAEHLIIRAKSNAKDGDKDTIQNTINYFDRINEAEKEENLEDKN